MICSSCRRRLLSKIPSRARSTQLQTRYTSTAPSTSPAPRQPPADIALQPSKTSPSATSSNTPGLSQPLSTPMFPSTASASRPGKVKSQKEQKLMGSIPGGTPLHGLGYLKAKPTVLAMEDDEYPEWLWTLLDPASGATSKEGMSGADVAALPKKARERYLKTQGKLRQSLPKTIPIHEQSQDLTHPGDSVEVSMQRRQELVRSSRKARRKGIKEENFLRGM